MAARKKPAKPSAAPASKRARRVRPARIAFEALSIEGGILSPEWLARIAQLAAAHQAEADYRVPKGLLLRDEIGRFWRIAQAHWADFEAGRAAVGTAPQAVADRFVLALLGDAFGFQSLVAAEPTVIGERTYPVRHRALEGRVPVVIAPAGSGVDTLSPAFGDDGRRRSAFGLAQEALNAGEHALWGIATDGATLRVLRDNASLTRPAWIEADLERIFREERYADFAALWLLAHESRFGAQGGASVECSLEVWRHAGREEGTRAREHLREGVEDALVALGQGFLAHPDNDALRDALDAGKLTAEGYFQQLLRLVYRLIFLLTAEERCVLHPDGADPAARARYEAGYGLRRLRDRSVRRSAHDRFADLWDGLRIVLRGVARGEPRLALPALGGLFAEDQCPALDVAKLENRALLMAVFRLSWLREASGLARVNWRDMGPEELGSVYESLLELVPRITEDGRGFAFAQGADAKGNARKTTGSYYTPDSLVQVLLDSALEPVVQQTVAGKSNEEAVRALLSLTVVDPACGSGHFLLAAARRLADHVARREANGTPSAAQYRHALRQVVSRCLFGVDLNPMAVELCRVSLWMEAVEPGRPLSFLDSHVQVGNALLGTTPELMAKGIPDAAFEPIEGDDRKTASLLKKRNKAAAEGQRGLESLWSRKDDEEATAVVTAVKAIDEAPDAELAQVVEKEAGWEKLQESEAYRHQRFVADAWCAAFVWPKPAIPERKAGREGETEVPAVVAAAPTNDLWRQIRDGQGKPPAGTVETVEELAKQYRFFHWHLQFPQVFARGGFDVVLGNPPWEMPETDERTVLVNVAPDVARDSSPQRRKDMLAGLRHSNPAAWEVWNQAIRVNDGIRALLARSGRFPASAVGRLNLCRAFVEHDHAAISNAGRVGVVVQSGFWSAEYERPLWHKLLQAGAVVSIYDFENALELFPGVHRSARFALLGLTKRGQARFSVAFWVRSPEEVSREARNGNVRVTRLSLEDVRALDPQTLSIPQFRHDSDLRILLEMVKKHQALGVSRAYAHTPRLMFSSSDDAFNVVKNDDVASVVPLANGRKVVAGTELLPVYEGKMVDIFDHRHADVVVNRANLSRPAQERPIVAEEKRSPERFAEPQLWIPINSVRGRRFGESTGQGDWEVAFCDVTASTNERTAIAAVVPLAGLNRSLPAIYLQPPNAKRAAEFVALIGSYAFDFLARLRVTGNHLTQGILASLPVPEPVMPPALGDEFLRTRALELIYTAWDLEPFARDIPYTGPPFRWDPKRRFLLRAELDAAFFHLYGISRDDADYILETFPIARKNDEKAYDGDYRTKRVILEIYDELAEAIRTGRPYQTRLDPPPADPRVAHPPRAEPRKAKAH